MIDRPGTADSAPLPSPKNEGSDSAIQNNARWLHDQVLPALWSTYGKLSNATSIVLFCHSFGATIGIATAALYARSTSDGTQTYPLSGLILSAFAHKTKPLPQDITFTPSSTLDPTGNPTHLSWPQSALDETMLNVSRSAISAEILTQHAGMTGPVSVAEMTDMSAPNLWQSYWRRLANEIRVPVFCGVGDADAMIEGTGEVMREFTAAFEKAGRAEWTVLKGAPHALELSWYSRAWYARCCGWALQCAVEADLEKERDQ